MLKVISNNVEDFTSTIYVTLFLLVLSFLLDLAATFCLSSLELLYWHDLEQSTFPLLFFKIIPAFNHHQMVADQQP